MYVHIEIYIYVECLSLCAIVCRASEVECKLSRQLRVELAQMAVGHILCLGTSTLFGNLGAALSIPNASCSFTVEQFMGSMYHEATTVSLSTRAPLCAEFQQCWGGNHDVGT